MGTSLGLRQATQISNFSRSATLKPVANLVQNVSAASDLVSALDAYESELISFSGTISGSFTSAGTGFESAMINTVGISGDSNFRLRLPATIREANDLASGCTIALGPTPMWRNAAQAQPSAWTGPDVEAISCTAPVVVSALAQSATPVLVTFSRLIDPASVEPGGGQFVFDNGLTASAAVVSGRTVTVTTSAQVLGQVYLVTVQNTVTDTLGSGIQSPNSAAFQGFEQAAQVLINEINANITSGCDLVELRVQSSGTMNGFQLWERNASVLTFAGLNVVAGDIVIVHFNGSSTLCSIDSPNETTSKSQYPSASFTKNYDTAWDWFSVDSGLTNTDNVITLYDMHGLIQDAVFLADDATGLAAATTETQAAAAAAMGEWEKVGGGIPPGGFIDDDFRAHAVLDLNGTSTSAVGVTIQRAGNTDTNTKADWGMAEHTWGLLNQ